MERPIETGRQEVANISAVLYAGRLEEMSKRGSVEAVFTFIVKGVPSTLYYS